MCKCKPFTQKSATSFLEVVLKRALSNHVCTVRYSLLKPHVYFQKTKHQQGCLLNTGINEGSARMVQFGEGNRLPPMWPRFKSWHQHHNYVGWVNCFLVLFLLWEVSLQVLWFSPLLLQHFQFQFDQAPVVQTLDSAIHQIKIYPLDNAIGFPNTYPQDSDLFGG